MIGLDLLYALSGALFLGIALSHVRDRANPDRWRSAGFWGCFGVVLLLGSWLPDFVLGLAVLAMAGLAAAGLKPAPAPTADVTERTASAARFGNRLFLPALAVPVITLAGSLLIADGRIGGFTLIDPRQVTLVSLAAGALAGLALATAMLRPPVSAPIVEGRRLADSIGWAIVLPQLLAALGAIFAASGVGNAVSELMMRYAPIHTPIAAVFVYTAGMAIFTMIMGNAFAAFPVMTAGVALPFIIERFGGDPVVTCAVGMLSGFCGTLMTPMAANYNLVPAAILELQNRYGVIMVQIPTALMLLAFNFAVMAWFAF